MEEDYAILRIHLVDSVPAYEFSKLTSLLNDIYDTFLWVDEVNIKGLASQTFHPSKEEKLYIKKADIGTPNVLEFMGIAKHLIDTAGFLAENYNILLTLGSAALITVEKTASLQEFMNKVRFAFAKKTSKEINIALVNIYGNRLLEEELLNLKHSNKLDRESEEEKNNFMNYVKNIGQLSENIIINSDITIIKSE